MSYSQAWLESTSSIRVALVIATCFNVQTNTETNFYFSTGGYSTTDGTQFNPIIINQLSLQESISSSSDSSMTFGDIELFNAGGELDDLLDVSKYKWPNRNIKVYWGDPGWSSSLANIPNTFLTIFNGTIRDIDSRVAGTINLKIRDKLEMLSDSISENKIGVYGVWPGGQQNKDQLRPIVFGECFNITPVLINPATLEYCFSSSNPEQVPDAIQTSVFNNNGESESLVEIRDNGVPIYNSTITGNATVNLLNSTFKLLKTPAGTITCTVQGVKKYMGLESGNILENAYNNNIPSIIGMIVQKFGKSTNRFTVTDIDLPTFQDFGINNEIGLLVQGSETVLAVCSQIASSYGGQLVMSRTGKLRLLKYGVPISTSIIPNVSISPSDILYDSFNISYRYEPSSTIKLGYAKNYTIQDGLVTSIPTSHKVSMSTQWYTVSSVDTNTVTLYNLTTNTEQVDTCLISTVDCQTECDRRLAYYKIPKTVFRFMGIAKLLSLQLGQQVTLTHPRFGLSSGKVGQVVSLNPNWSRDQVEVEVIV